MRFKGNWPEKKLVFHTHFFFLIKALKFLFWVCLNKPVYFKNEFDNSYIIKVILFYRNHKEDKHKKTLKQQTDK